MNVALSFFLSLLLLFPADASRAAGKQLLGSLVAPDLTLTLNLPKKTYGPSDEIQAEITLKNNSEQTIFVRRFVGWGESSSVSVWIRDASGQSVSSEFLADEVDPPVVSVQQLEELRPGASKRFTLKIPLAEYSLKQGKSYSLTVVYHSSISPKTRLSQRLLTAVHPGISSSSVFAVK